MKPRKSAVVPPSLTVDQMKGVVAGAEAASQQAEVTAAATLELQGASAPPAPAQRSSSSGSPYRRSSRYKRCSLHRHVTTQPPVCVHTRICSFLTATLL